MDFLTGVAAPILALVVALVTITGGVASATWEARKRRLIAFLASETQRAPDQLQPSLQALHREAVADYVAMQAARASFRSLGALRWGSFGAICVSLGVFGFTISQPGPLDVELCFIAVAMSIIGVQEGALLAGAALLRSRFRAHLQNRLYLGKQPDESEVAKARMPMELELLSGAEFWKLHTIALCLLAICIGCGVEMGIALGSGELEHNAQWSVAGAVLLAAGVAVGLGIVSRLIPTALRRVPVPLLVSSWVSSSGQPDACVTEDPPDVGDDART